MQGPWQVHGTPMQGRADCGTSITTGKYPSVREERNWSDGGAAVRKRDDVQRLMRLPVRLACHTCEWLPPTPYSCFTLAGNNISRQPRCFERHCGAFQTFRSCCEMLRGSDPTPEPYPSCGAKSCGSALTPLSSAERGLRPRPRLADPRVRPGNRYGPSGSGRLCGTARFA